MERKSYLLFAVVLLAFFLRVSGVNRLFFGDETDWARTVDTITKGTDTLILKVHPPMTMFIYSALSLLFKNLRAVPVIFGMLTIVLTYFIANKLSKKVAMLSLVFISFSYYHVLASQLVDMDGGILTFFIFLSYFLLLNGSYSLSAVLFLFALLTRPTAIIFMLPIGFYLLKSENLRRGMPYIVALIAFVPIWLLIDRLTIPTFMETVNHYLTYSSADLRSLLAYKLLNGARIITRITPPALFALIAFYLMRKEGNRILDLLSFHLLAAFLFFLFTHGGDQVRYFSVTIPAISIIISYFASRELFRMRVGELLFASCVYIVVLILMDFNEINLLLLPVLLLVTLIPVAFYKNPSKLVAVYFVLSIVFSLFMLSGIRTYDELRSYAVSDILKKLDELGVNRIILLQERGVGYYLKGSSEFVGSIDTFNAKVSKGDYAVNEPMMPSQLPDYVKSYFWRVELREVLKRNCSTVYEKEMHGIVVDEIYRC